MKTLDDFTHQELANYLCSLSGGELVHIKELVEHRICVPLQIFANGNPVRDVLNPVTKDDNINVMLFAFDRGQHSVEYLKTRAKISDKRARELYDSVDTHPTVWLYLDDGEKPIDMLKEASENGLWFSIPIGYFV